MTGRAAYRIFCEQHEATIPVFQQPWYLDAACGSDNWDAVFLIQRNDPEQKIIAVMPFYLKKKLGFTYIQQPALVKWWSPLIAPQLRHKEQSFLAELIEQLPKVAYHVQQFYSDITDWLPFYWAGYQQTTQYYYEITELQNWTAVYQHIDSGYRRRIRLAATKLSLTDAFSANDFFTLNRATLLRNESDVGFTQAEFLRWYDALEQHSSGKIFAVQDAENRIHAACYLFWDAEAAYVYFGCDDPSLRQDSGYIYVLYEAMRFGQEVLKVSRFVFTGSMIQRIERILRQFGATQRSYFKVWKHHSVAFQLLQAIKQR
ncbi:MAG: hypothetical protein KA974_05435 [Saprospiraceae bacterium]|nr:hypothetical protein [Saprospiraceae bacterium]MBP7679622.1 hypothetical protein [Saprospiraceae bacterium]